MKSTTPRWVWMALWAAAAASFALKFWLILGRRIPYNDDELIYLVESATMAAFGTFTSEYPAFDTPSRYAPLYSLVLAPCSLLTSDPVWQYRLALLVGALVTSSIVFPAFFLLRRLVGWRAVAPAALLGFWATPFFESLVAMSEALFHPLFLWTGLAYVRLAERARIGRAVVLTLLLAALVLTRNAGVAVVPAVMVALWLDLLLRQDGSTVGKRLALAAAFSLAVAILPWAAFTTWRAVLDAPVEGQTVERYARLGLSALASPAGVRSLAVAFGGQLACIVAGSLGLAAAVLAVFVHRLGMNIRERVSLPHAMWSQAFYFGLGGAGLLAASVVHMYSGMRRLPDVEKFYMYGRYVEMLVPPLVMYGAAYVLAFKAEPIKRRAAILGSAFVLTVLAFAYALHASTGKSVLWLNVVERVWWGPVLLFAGIAALFAIAFSPLRNPGRGVILVALLLVPQAIGAHAFARHLANREEQHFGRHIPVDAMVRQLRDVAEHLRTTDGVIWVRSVDRRHRIALVHRYVFHKDLRPCRGFPDEMGPDDYYYLKGQLHPAPFSRERHQNDP